MTIVKKTCTSLSGLMAKSDTLRFALFFLFCAVTLSSRSQTATLADKVFGYAMAYATPICNEERNLYFKYDFRTARRNPALMLVPTMYAIARGKRNYTGETYGRIKFTDVGDYLLKSQVTVGTIRNHRKIMPIMVQYITPDLYGNTLIGNFLLSPFSRDNRKFYTYKVKADQGRTATLDFSPRTDNTQLVRGDAKVDKASGKILSARISGNYDMVDFRLTVEMDSNSNSVLPNRSEVLSTFRFIGNRIDSKLVAVFNCGKHLADSMANIDSMAMMDRLRPEPLTTVERAVYSQKVRDDSLRKADTNIQGNSIVDKAWDIVGDHLLSSKSVRSDNAYIRLSPLMNPLYFSYSQKRGLSYKLTAGAYYKISSQRGLSLTPKLGYNFKQGQFFFTAPLRYTFSEHQGGWIEATLANGNRITNSSVIEKVKSERMDTINFSNLNLDYFRDTMYGLSVNYQIGSHWTANAGSIFHRRIAVNRQAMKQLGKPSVYRSCAPFVTLTYCPSPSLPVLTASYERAIPHLLMSDTRYERFEFDASYKKRLRQLRQYSVRVGGGFYTDKSTDFFVDYDNFHEDYLPDGWDDDWTGHFQLLNSDWYNASKYYVRANATYESPMFLLTQMPWVGRLVETERIYASVLQIEHISTPYVELGYGFTNRYFSIGLFSNFVNRKFHEFGSKFTFELFRRW